MKIHIIISHNNYTSLRHPVIVHYLHPVISEPTEDISLCTCVMKHASITLRVYRHVYSLLIEEHYEGGLFAQQRASVPEQLPHTR